MTAAIKDRWQQEVNAYQWRPYHFSWLLRSLSFLLNLLWRRFALKSLAKFKIFQRQCFNSLQFGFKPFCTASINYQVQSTCRKPARWLYQAQMFHSNNKFHAQRSTGSLLKIWPQLFYGPYHSSCTSASQTCLNCLYNFSWCTGWKTSVQWLSIGSLTLQMIGLKIWGENLIL